MPLFCAADAKRAAAERIEPLVGNMLTRVYRFLRNSGGACDRRGAAVLHMKPDTYRARRCELCDAGLVRDARRVETYHGDSLTVWEASPGVRYDEKAVVRAVARAREAKRARRAAIRTIESAWDDLSPDDKQRILGIAQGGAR